MREKMGGVGIGTGNTVPDSYGEQDNTENCPPSPRQALLTLLERDALLHTRCDMCQKLHSPLWEGSSSTCGAQSSSLTIRNLGGNEVIITQPLLRGTMAWHRRGLDALSLLGRLYISTTWNNPRTNYAVHSESKPKIVSGAILLRQQIVIIRKDGADPWPVTGHDLAALDEVLGRAGIYSGWLRPPQLAISLWNLKHLVHPDCAALVDTLNGPFPRCPNAGHLVISACFRNDKVALSKVAPQLRCILTHEIACSRCKWSKSTKNFLGDVYGETQRYINFSFHTTTLEAEGKKHTRALVITTWKDFGDGSSVSEPRWASHHPWLKSPAKPCERVSRTYEVYEGAAEGSKYTPRLSKAIIRTLGQFVSCVSASP